uniref:SGNH hydrolase-type esterase domain-containing protein n=1 Tax=Pseudictyota dubia TaxID=2749911 RepID=A0A7R9Z4S7_9STRA|mmetsp:Transcript_21708/g.40530  ORF Transcript_21708/g.40530 Transcript_21708/m.40530 type:complete len:136 (+) Transcript_21708:177-584(+)
MLYASLSSGGSRTETTEGGKDDGMSSSFRRLVFLGPKFEPWLKDDPIMRKSYVKLSKAMRRACDRHERRDEVSYVDCLTMFCGKTAQVPGALLGGRAIPEDQYFHGDGLHLSEQGYAIWKEVVQEILEDAIMERK